MALLYQSYFFLMKVLFTKLAKQIYRIHRITFTFTFSHTQFRQHATNMSFSNFLRWSSCAYSGATPCWVMDQWHHRRMCVIWRRCFRQRWPHLPDSYWLGGRQRCSWGSRWKERRLRAPPWSLSSLTQTCQLALWSRQTTSTSFTCGKCKWGRTQSVPHPLFFPMLLPYVHVCVCVCSPTVALQTAGPGGTTIAPTLHSRGEPSPAAGCQRAAARLRDTATWPVEEKRESRFHLPAQL